MSTLELTLAMTRNPVRRPSWTGPSVPMEFQNWAYQQTAALLDL